MLLMKDFLVRFAQVDPSAESGHKFSTVREGLIVALLSIGPFPLTKSNHLKLTLTRTRRHSLRSAVRSLLR